MIVLSHQAESVSTFTALTCVHAGMFQVVTAAQRTYKETLPLAVSNTIGVFEVRRGRVVCGEVP